MLDYKVFYFSIRKDWLEAIRIINKDLKHTGEEKLNELQDIMV